MSSWSTRICRPCLFVASSNLVAERSAGVFVSGTDTRRGASGRCFRLRHGSRRGASGRCFRRQPESHRERPAGVFFAGANLVADGRKLRPHLIAEQQNLRRQRIYTGRQFFETSHACFQGIHSCNKGLRRHRQLLFGRYDSNQRATFCWPDANAVPTLGRRYHRRKDEATADQGRVTCRLRKYASVPGPTHRPIAPLVTPRLRSLTISVGCSAPLT